jgi:hypothetical protein
MDGAVTLCSADWYHHSTICNQTHHSQMNNPQRTQDVSVTTSDVDGRHNLIRQSPMSHLPLHYTSNCTHCPVPVQELTLKRKTEAMRPVCA